MQATARLRVAVMHEDAVVSAGLRALLGAQLGIELLEASAAQHTAVLVVDYERALALLTRARSE